MIETGELHFYIPKIEKGGKDTMKTLLQILKFEYIIVIPYTKMYEQHQITLSFTFLSPFFRINTGRHLGGIT